MVYLKFLAYFDKTNTYLPSPIMLKFESYRLKNGLKVIIQQDTHTSMSVIGLIYLVGSRNENPNRTGLAHLLEHLMFTGSKSVSNFDRELEKIGAQNNAFTSTDVTFYYIETPPENLETALWVESDRVLNLQLNEKNLQIQKDVVCEEFKQSYLNQPYGDAWALLNSLSYTKHPYSWPTIGKSIQHIQETSLKEVKDFYSKYYCPNNAALVIIGNIDPEETKKYIDKWFSTLPSNKLDTEAIAAEPEAKQRKALTITRRNIALDAIYKSYHMGGRFDQNFYEADMLARILGSGESSILYSELVAKQGVFNSMYAYTTETIDPGLLVIEGKVNQSISIQEADKALTSVLENVRKGEFCKKTLTKTLNQLILTNRLDQSSITERAILLANYAINNRLALYTKEHELYNKVTAPVLKDTSNVILNPDNCASLFYKVER